MKKARFSFSLNPHKIILILAITSVVNVLLSLIGQYLRFNPNSYNLSNAIQEFFLDLFIFKFDVNNESNIPTYFNTLLLFFASLLAFVLSAVKFDQKDKYRYEWLTLASLLLVMSLDEAAAIHERFSILLKDLPDIGGFLAYKWVIGGMVVVAILAAAFLRFFLHFDHRNRLFLFLASTIYLFGALGSEMISGRYQALYGAKNFTFALLTTLEESLEWIGILLLIFFLMKYIEAHITEVKFLPQGASARPPRIRK
jgi:hypothetical protein